MTANTATSTMRELLFEIGAEEIPASYIEPALTSMAARAARKLKELGLAYGDIKTYGTPRRLTLAIRALQDRQPDRRQEHIGPSKAAGMDGEGRMTKAALGFARSHGLQAEELQIVKTAKGEYLMAIEDIKGQESRVLLPALLESLVRETVFPKSMRWGDSTLSFARPIQWLLALYDGEVLPLHIENIPCGACSRGHRFLAPEPFAVNGLDTYLQELSSRFVLVDMATRREKVKAEVNRAVHEQVPLADAQAVLHEGLVNIVTNLVEYPYPICGRFDEKFLQLPSEVLITSMREHQKYFPVQDAAGNLLPYFVAVNNTNVADRQLAASGHERVLRARLEDALFFFNEDRARPLASRCQDLDGIVFQQKLGTMQAKMERISALAARMAQQLAPEQEEAARRAAQLAKADLLTSMVGEFPSLQGIMGRVYARHDGEGEAVAQAIAEHYMPLRAGEAVPSSLLGALVGLADRMDTLVGCFAIGEKPTGNKDAFGLRRQALGLINIIRRQGLSLSLRELAQAALAQYSDLPGDKSTCVDEVLNFIRLRFENEEIAEGQPQELVEAATAARFDDICDCLLRIKALADLQKEENFRVLAASFKRIRNIVKENRATDIKPELFTEEAEHDLYAALNELRQKSQPLLAAAEYRQALGTMLLIKEPVDRFFDQVMVMAEDQQQRQNRLNLLTALKAMILQVADIAKMNVEEH